MGTPLNAKCVRCVNLHIQREKVRSLSGTGRQRKVHPVYEFTYEARPPPDRQLGSLDSVECLRCVNLQASAPRPGPRPKVEELKRLPRPARERRIDNAPPAPPPASGTPRPAGVRRTETAPPAHPPWRRGHAAPAEPLGHEADRGRIPARPALIELRESGNVRTTASVASEPLAVARQEARGNRAKKLILGLGYPSP